MQRQQLPIRPRKQSYRSSSSTYYSDDDENVQQYQVHHTSIGPGRVTEKKIVRVSRPQEGSRTVSVRQHPKQAGKNCHCKRASTGYHSHGKPIITYD
jgi:hypothetical protein